jgi:hypothetical protein
MVHTGTNINQRRAAYFLQMMIRTSLVPHDVLISNNFQVSFSHWTLVQIQRLMRRRNLYVIWDFSASCGTRDDRPYAEMTDNGVPKSAVTLVVPWPESEQVHATLLFGPN